MQFPMPMSGQMSEMGDDLYLDEGSLIHVQGFPARVKQDTDIDAHPANQSLMGAKRRHRTQEKRGGPEIHSAKAHRCVDKVSAKGHDTSSAWAICTASIGKRGVYAKGHGGNANPKSAVKEACGVCDNCKQNKKRLLAEMDQVVSDALQDVAEKGFSNAKPGSGGRFAACVASGKSRELCAYIGRRKYGASGMAKMAAAGRKH